MPSINLILWKVPCCGAVLLDVQAFPWPGNSEERKAVKEQESWTGILDCLAVYFKGFNATPEYSNAQFSAIALAFRDVLPSVKPVR